MSTKVARGGALEFAPVAGERPAPPSPAPPAAPSSPAPSPIDTASGPRAVPVGSILDLAAAPARAGGRPFGQIVSRARGVLGRSAGLISAVQASRARPWRALRFRGSASVAQVTTAHASPGDTLAVPAALARHKKSWREQRWERRRKRRVTEEVLGWILVPIILISVAWAARSGLNALGTTPTALIQGIKAAVSGRS